jgi:hypothetical protein
MAFNSYIWDEQFDLNVSRGKVRGASQIHKFGATPSQSINTTASIWDKEDTLYPWSAFDTPGVLVAAQVGAADNGKVVTIEGLDENYELTSEDFTLSSTGTVTGTQTFKRVYRGFVSSGAGTNEGQLNFSRGGTQVLRILANAGQTLMAIYTVPAGYTGYLYKGVATAQSGADATGWMYVRYNSISTVFRVGHTFEVAGGGEYEYEFSFPQEMPEKTDIDVRLTTRSNNGRFTAAFDILLIKNQL